MKDQVRGSAPLRVAIVVTLAGTLLCLALLIGQTPYTLAAFMFLAQPLLATGWGLFAYEVFRDWRGLL